MEEARAPKVALAEVAVLTLMTWAPLAMDHPRYVPLILILSMLYRLNPNTGRLFREARATAAAKEEAREETKEAARALREVLAVEVEHTPMTWTLVMDHPRYVGRRGVVFARYHDPNCNDALCSREARVLEVAPKEARAARKALQEDPKEVREARAAAPELTVATTATTTEDSQVGLPY